MVWKKTRLHPLRRLHFHCGSFDGIRGSSCSKYFGWQEIRWTYSYRPWYVINFLTWYLVIIFVISPFKYSYSRTFLSLPPSQTFLSTPFIPSNCLPLYQLSTLYRNRIWCRKAFINTRVGSLSIDSRNGRWYGNFRSRGYFSTLLRAGFKGPETGEKCNCDGGGSSQTWSTVSLVSFHSPSGEVGRGLFPILLFFISF